MEESGESKIEESKAQAVASPYLIPGAIIVAGFLVASTIIYTNYSPRVVPTPNSGALSTPVNLSNLADDDPFLGNPLAPVTIVEFGDFQCPFCGRFFQETEPQIIEKYVKTGKAKFVYRDFPLTAIHENAQKSAEAAECAHEQGKFWPYHDLLFARQNSLGVDNYKAWAAELGLNKTQFNNCLDSGKYVEEIQKDYNDGQAAGVNGTPATFVNGRLISGAVPFAEFQKVIEEESRKAK